MNYKISKIEEIIEYLLDSDRKYREALEACGIDEETFTFEDYTVLDDSILYCDECRVWKPRLSHPHRLFFINGKSVCKQCYSNSSDNDEKFIMRNI